LISTIFLFRFERPATFFGPQDGDHDIRNLYSQIGTRGESTAEISLMTTKSPDQPRRSQTCEIDGFVG